MSGQVIKVKVWKRDRTKGDSWHWREKKGVKRKSGNAAEEEKKYLKKARKKHESPDKEDY